MAVSHPAHRCLVFIYLCDKTVSNLLTRDAPGTNPRGEPAHNECTNERLSRQGHRDGVPSREKPPRQNSISQGFLVGSELSQHFYHLASSGDWEDCFGRDRGGVDLKILGKSSRSSNLLLSGTTKMPLSVVANWLWVV